MCTSHFHIALLNISSNMEWIVYIHVLFLGQQIEKENTEILDSLDNNENVHNVTHAAC